MAKNRIQNFIFTDNRGKKRFIPQLKDPHFSTTRLNDVQYVIIPGKALMFPYNNF